MVRLVLFDIDGTLIRTGGAGVRAFDEAFAREFQVPNGTAHMNFAGRTDTSLIREAMQLHGVEPTPERTQHFFATYAQLLHENLGKGKGHVCPGVPEFIRGLQSLPQPPLIGLLTGNIRLGAEIKLRHFALWDCFVTGAFADDAEDRNHIAAVARKRGCEQLGAELRGEEIVVVGDTAHDVNCARAIGAKPLAVGTGDGKLEELRNLRPTWAVAHLTALTAAEVCA